MTLFGFRKWHSNSGNFPYKMIASLIVTISIYNANLKSRSMKTPLFTLLSEKQGGIYSVSPDATVREAALMMNDHHIGSVVVLEETKLVGIFTERDVMKRIVMNSLDPSVTLVGQVMTEKVTTVPVTTTVGKAMELMVTMRLRHLPVMKDGELVGVISIRDLTGCISKSFEFETDALWSFIKSGFPHAVSDIK